MLAVWVIIAWKFNGLYGQDPFAYYDYGVGPLRRSVLQGTPLTAMFWPLGYPLLITIVSLVVGPITAAGQIMNLLAASVAVCFTYLLGRDLLLSTGIDPRVARRAGVLGALLLGMTGRLIESSVLITADSVALATSLISAWALVRWITAERKNRRRSRFDSHNMWLVLSTTALAWSVITRWAQAILALVWIAAVLFETVAPDDPDYPPILWTRLWRAIPWAIAPAVAIIGAQLWLVFTVQPEADLGRYPFAGDLSLVDGTGSGWSVWHLFQDSFVNADGVQHYDSPNALFYLTGAFRPQYITPLFFPAVLLGLVTVATGYGNRMLRADRVTRARVLLLLLTWPAVLLLFDAGLAEQNPRFILAALPPIAILSGLGLACAWDQVTRLRSRLADKSALVLLAAGLIVVATAGLREVARLNSARNSDLQVAAWTAAQVPGQATVLSFGITLTLQHATNLRVQDLSVLSERDLQRLLAVRRPLYLLVQIGSLGRQFAALAPGIDYRFLRDNPGLITLGMLHGYTLARTR